MSASDVTTYLAKLDAHLATLGASAAVKELEGERERVERLEQAVAAWAEKGRGDSPSRFSAWDLGIIDGELSIRITHEREKIAD